MRIANVIIMDPKNSKLRKLSFKNFKNTFSCKRSDGVEHSQGSSSLISGLNHSENEKTNPPTRNCALILVKNIKKKCKGTLSNCTKPKSEVKTSSHCIDFEEETSVSQSHVPVILLEVNIPPPLPPRLLSNSVVSHKSRGIQEELSTLVKHGWYWGSISRTKVEEKLRNQPDGSFLVRDSSSDNYILTLSFRSSGRVLHTRIEHSFGYYTFFSQQEGYTSISDLVESSMVRSAGSILCYVANRENDIYPGYPVRLIKPISRFTEVRDLQHLCRFVIRQYVPVNNITNLPLPNTLKIYLQQDYW